MAKQRDLLDEIVNERSKQNPEFSALVQAALERRMANPEGAEAAHKPAADPAGLREFGD